LGLASLLDRLAYCVSLLSMNKPKLAKTVVPVAPASPKKGPKMTEARRKVLGVLRLRSFGVFDTSGLPDLDQLREMANMSGYEESEMLKVLEAAA